MLTPPPHPKIQEQEITTTVWDDGDAVDDLVETPEKDTEELPARATYKNAIGQVLLGLCSCLFFRKNTLIMHKYATAGETEQAVFGTDRCGMNCICGAS